MSAGKIINKSIDVIGKVGVKSINDVGKIGGGTVETGTPYKKFYFSSSGTPDLSPGYAGWGNTTSAQRHTLLTAKDWSDFAEKTITGTSTSYLYQQFVSSAALIAQTVEAGYIEGQIRAAVNGYGSVCFRFSVKICNSSGTITQTIISGAVSDTTFSNAGYMNRQFRNGSDNTVNFSSFTTNAGDRLVVEIGTDVGYWQGASLYIGSNSSTDLPKDQTTTSQYCPWIEFSNNLYFS